jgi:phenylalanyl-tRNA synthetase beta chain
LPLQVTVPPTRSDVLHPVDVIEDVAIAYGFNKIPICVPPTQCSGSALPINQLTDLLRSEIARLGYNEMLTHGLCSTAENFTHLLRPVGPAASLSNPANVEYEVVRTTLLPGALKTLSYNKKASHKDGIRLFEISDVVLPVPNEIGAMNARRLVGLYSAYSSGFEIIHGLADRVMTCVQIRPDDNYAQSSLTAVQIAALKKVARPGVSYTMRPSTDPCFFPGMSADIVLQFEEEGKAEQVIGSMGVVHPKLLQNFDISYPCSVLEMDVDALM